MDANERMTAAQYQAMRQRMYGQGFTRGLRLPGWQIAPGEPPGEPLVEPPGFRVESDFQTWLRDWALRHGWEFYHTWSSKRSDPGYPDCHMVKPPYECIAELKMAEEKPGKDQIRWLTKLSAVRKGSQTQTVCLWYPEHTTAIIAYLGQPDACMPPGIWERTP